MDESPATGSLGDDFPVPISDRCFEDYLPGVSYEYGHVTVSEREIIEFASRYDPQPMHIDPVRAAAGAFGGLIASGWHTAALCMRVLVDHYLPATASVASPGIDELRWLRPVRPGDVLRVRARVEGSRRSKSNPDRGIVRTRIEALNQANEVVMTLIAVNLMLCRQGAV